MAKSKVTFKSNLDVVVRKTNEAAKAALMDVVADLQNRSQQLAPLDTGDLRGSASHEVRDIREGYAGFVGYSVPYSIVQHEDLSLSHDEGQAKFLEEPALANQEKYVQHIRDALRQEMQ